MKRILALALAVCLWVGLAVPAMALGDTAQVGKAQTVSAGFASSYAIDENGVLWAWGDNSYGQLGDGTQIDRPTPVKVMEDVVSVAAGNRHAAALRADGSLWVWGENARRQMGNGVWDQRKVYPTPTKVMDDVVAVAVGLNHTMAIKRDGTLWGFGAVMNKEDRTLTPTPEKVMDGVAAVSCGQDHTMALKTDGTLWAWGINDFGEFGIPSIGQNRVYYSATPVQVMDHVASVAAGYNYTMAVKTDGTLWAFGCNLSGEQGIGSIHNGAYWQPGPQQVMDGVAAVATGWEHTMIIKTDGSLWACGKHYDGQLGIADVPIREDGEIDTSQKYLTPVKVTDGVAAVSCGWEHTIALKTDGTVWTWGAAGDGQLGYREVNVGVGSRGCQTVPKEVKLAMVEPTALEPRTSGTAYAATQSVWVDGKVGELQAYALKSTVGNLTNYVKVRDVAHLLDGTPAQFNVGWDGAVNLETGKPYTSRNGQENQTPYTGEQPYTKAVAETKVNGKVVELAAFVLVDEEGNGSTYYKLRDLGQALGFNVGWDGATGVFLETDKPYDAEN